MVSQPGRGNVVVVVVLIGSDVVVVVAHPEPAHASQQLVAAPTHAVPRLGALQWAASFATLHFAPFGFVMQHVTNPGFPHVDRAAHRWATPLQRLFASVSPSTRAEHRVYSP
jgi:hypothetical protein